MLKQLIIEVFFKLFHQPFITTLLAIYLPDDIPPL